MNIPVWNVKYCAHIDIVLLTVKIMAEKIRHFLWTSTTCINSLSCHSKSESQSPSLKIGVSSGSRGGAKGAMAPPLCPR